METDLEANVIAESAWASLAESAQDVVKQGYPITVPFHDNEVQFTFDAHTGVVTARITRQRVAVIENT